MTLVEMGLPADVGYHLRHQRAEAVTDLLITAMNEFFRRGGIQHEGMAGLVTKDRVRIFSTDGPGLRALLGLSVAELNEKQSPFFRYAIYEILFSKAARKAVRAWVDQRPADERGLWTELLAKLADEVKAQREDYIGRAFKAALKEPEWQRHTMPHCCGA